MQIQGLIVQKYFSYNCLATAIKLIDNCQQYGWQSPNECLATAKQCTNLVVCIVSSICFKHLSCFLTSLQSVLDSVIILNLTTANLMLIAENIGQGKAITTICLLIKLIVQHRIELIAFLTKRYAIPYIRP